MLPAASSVPLPVPAPSAPPRFNPWPFVLTLPLMSALPNAASLGVATIFYKSLGYSNEFIGYTGALFVPFALSFLWAPCLDRSGTKRGWQLGLSLALAAAFAALAGVVACHPATPWPTLAAITAIAFVGGTAEVSMNGYFLHALDARQQAAFSGVRVAAIRCGQILATGVLLKLSADHGVKAGDPLAGWTWLFGVLAALFLGSFAYHAWVLPRPPTDRPVPVSPGLGSYRRAWAEFRSLPGVGAIVAFYLTYRLGEGLMVRMTAPFLLDAPARGGLGLSVGDVAIAQGTVGFITSILGGILGGWLIKVRGLRRTALPLALCMTLPHAGYLWLALARAPSFAAVQACVAVETFGYGMGFACMFTMTMVIPRGEYRATLVAILVALWSAGWLAPTFFSGLIEAHVGYLRLFALSMVAALPGIVLICRLPLRQLDAALISQPGAAA